MKFINIPCTTQLMGILENYIYNKKVQTQKGESNEEKLCNGKFKRTHCRNNFRIIYRVKF